MSHTVTLRHTTHRLPARVEYFYDGIEVARDGMLTLSSSDIIRLKAVYLRGYQCSPDGTRIESYDFDSYIQDQTAKRAKTKKIS